MFHHESSESGGRHGYQVGRLYLFVERCSLRIASLGCHPSAGGTMFGRRKIWPPRIQLLGSLFSSAWANTDAIAVRLTLIRVLPLSSIFRVTTLLSGDTATTVP